MAVNAVKSNKTFTDLYGDHANNVVVFGNPDNTKEFEAHVKMKFWDEDYISFCEEGIKGEPTLKDGIIELDLDKRKFQWLKDGTLNLKWTEILYEKPVSNKWSLKIADVNQFDYFYQTPLAELSAKIAGSRIEYVTEDGKEYIHLIYPESHPLNLSGRPLDVDGSIAVYHKFKRDHIIGHKNYQTGKVLHILRPKAIDKGGKWIWCNIQVKNGIYTRTIPQSFLDNAVYPIMINDTFGTATYGASYDGFSTGYQYASSKGSPASSGSATNISFYARLVNDTVIATAGFWNDNSGAPGTLVEDASEVTNTGGADMTQWWPSDLDSPAEISSGSSYWLGTNQDHGSGLMRVYYDGTTQDLYWEQFTYVSGTLVNFSSPADTGIDHNHSIYLTYTPAGAGVAPTGVLYGPLVGSLGGPI